MPTLLLNGNAIKALAKISDVINIVGEAFSTCGEGRGKMPARAYLAVDSGDFRAMPAALLPRQGVNMGKRAPWKSISWSTFDLERGEN